MRRIDPRFLVVAALAGWALVAAGACAAPGQPQSPHTVDYEFTTDVALGAPGFQDYLTFDPESHRLYVSHYDRITVMDTRTNATVGSVVPLHDSHGVAVVTRLGKGYADSGDDGLVRVFSLADFHVLKEIKVSPDADGMVFDDRTGSILVVAGDSKNLTIINPSNDTVTRTIDLPGKPEYLAIDGAGVAYVNLADIAAIAKVDLSTGRLVATWTLAGCKAPHGLAYDPLSRRLFSGCSNGQLIVVDCSDGRNTANLQIGSGSDSVAVDPPRGLVFSANGDGTLTVIQEGTGDHYSVARTIPTFFGGRNMALDPTTGRLFVAHGNMKLESSLHDLLNLRFGWDGVDIAEFAPRP